MTDDKHLKGIEEEIDNLEDNDFKKNLKVAYENLKHFSGFNPCKGIWDSNQGKCIEDDQTDKPPKVSAGEDQDAIVGEKVLLAGEIEELNNYSVYHNWTKFSGPDGDLSITADGRSAEFTPSKEGEYILEFTVRDIKGLVASDQIKINAKNKEDKKESKNKDLKFNEVFGEDKEEKPVLANENKFPALEKNAQKPAQKPTTVDIQKVDDNPKINISEEKKPQNSKITIKGDKKD